MTEAQKKHSLGIYVSAGTERRQGTTTHATAAFFLFFVMLRAGDQTGMQGAARAASLHLKFLRTTVAQALLLPGAF